MSWQVICRPIQEGGLEIRTMEDQMKALRMKLAWIANNGSSQWSQLLKTKHKEWAYKQDQIKGPASWAQLQKAWLMMRKTLKWVIGQGEIWCWWDNWMGKGILGDLENVNPQRPRLKVRQFLLDD